MRTLKDFGLGLLLAGFFVLVHGYHSGKYEEQFYQPLVKHLINPELLKSDWFIGLPLYHATILRLLADLGRAVSVAAAFATLYFLSLAAFWAILVGWVRRHCPSGAVAIVMGVFWVPILGWGGYPLIPDYYVPGFSAMVVVLGAISLWFSAQWLWIPLLLAGTAWIHLLVGVNAGVLFAAGYLRRIFSERRMSVAWLALIMSAALVLVIPFVVNHLGEILLSRDSNFYSVNVVVRYPHHYWLSGKRRIVLLVALMAGLGTLIRKVPEPDVRRRWGWLWIGIWVMLGIQVLGGDLVKIPWAFQLQQLRITYWIPFFYIFLLASSYHRHPVFTVLWSVIPATFLGSHNQAMVLLLVTHGILAAADQFTFRFPPVPARLWRNLLIVHGCWLAVIVGIRGIPVDYGLEYLCQDSWGRMCRWIRSNTPPPAVFIAPPDRETFRLLTDRAIIADFKACPYREQDVRDWLLRMNDLTGKDLRSLPKRGFNLVDDIRKGYLSLSAAAVSGLGARYDARYIVTTASHPEFRVLHQEEAWRLYQLPGGE